MAITAPPRPPDSSPPGSTEPIDRDELEALIEAPGGAPAGTPRRRYGARAARRRRWDCRVHRHRRTRRGRGGNSRHRPRPGGAKSRPRARRRCCRSLRSRRASSSRRRSRSTRARRTRSISGHERQARVERAWGCSGGASTRRATTASTGARRGQPDLDARGRAHRRPTASGDAVCGHRRRRLQDGKRGSQLATLEPRAAATSTGDRGRPGEGDAGLATLRGMGGRARSRPDRQQHRLGRQRQRRQEEHRRRPQLEDSVLARQVHGDRGTRDRAHASADRLRGRDLLHTGELRHRQHNPRAARTPCCSRRQTAARPGDRRVSGTANPTGIHRTRG